MSLPMLSHPQTNPKTHLNQKLNQLPNLKGSRGLKSKMKMMLALINPQKLLKAMRKVNQQLTPRKPEISGRMRRLSCVPSTMPL
jgi:hypothetical protein